MNNLPVGILLAAGQSSRFGGNKLLHHVTGDTPMLMVVARKLSSVLSDSVTVINRDLLPYKEQLEQFGMQVVVNEHTEMGIGSSIACGVRANPEASGWLICLADMPYLESETISLLASKLRNNTDIIAPVFNGRRGHPVVFGQTYGSELISLNEDTGARHLIEKYNERLKQVKTDDEGVIRDIDYPVDIN
jgi:molybdenum cofactor cytidylyltransferase